MRAPPRWVVVAFLVSAGCRHGDVRARIAQDDCAGMEAHARAQTEAIAARYRASDLTRPADLLGLQAMIDDAMADARTNWSREVVTTPFDCHIDAIGTLWLSLDAVRIAVTAALPTSSDPAEARGGIPSLITRLQTEPMAAFQACRAALGAHCRH